MAAWADVVFPVVRRLRAAGFPGFAGGVSKTPFDFIGDSHRGTRGMILDMFRQPEKVIDTAGRDGGFILDIGAAADGGKDDNLRAMIQAAKRYGRYS
ncbi:MAG: hypothetical protein Kow00122_18330 [Thermoleophilia bacterium]